MVEYKRRSNSACSICGTLIYRRPVELVRSEGRAYCKQICYGLAQRKEHPCIICSKPILAGANKKTCSRSCSNKNRIGSTYEGRHTKDKVVYQKGLKTRLVEARGKVCGRCDYNKVEILQVHHKDRDRTHNDLKNLELICPNCHYEEHYLEKNQLSGMVHD